MAAKSAAELLEERRRQVLALAESFGASVPAAPASRHATAPAELCRESSRCEEGAHTSASTASAASIAEEEKEILVSRVKAAQRASDESKRAWWTFCKRHGSTSFDPQRHEAKFLDAFLKSLLKSDRASSDSDEEVEDRNAIIEMVKEIQRRSPENKKCWYAWCAMQGTADYDPTRHAASSLLRFCRAVSEGKFQGNRGKGKAAFKMELMAGADDSWESWAQNGAVSEPGGMASSASSSSTGKGPRGGAGGGGHGTYHGEGDDWPVENAKAGRSAVVPPSYGAPSSAKGRIAPVVVPPSYGAPSSAKGRIATMSSMVAEIMGGKAGKGAGKGKGPPGKAEKGPPKMVPAQWFATMGNSGGKSEFGVLDMEKPETLLARKRGAISSAAPEGGAGLMTEEQARAFQAALKRRR